MVEDVLEETQKTFSKAETSYSNYLHNSEWNLIAWEKRNGVSGAGREAAPKKESWGNYLPSVIPEYICWEPVVC